MWDDSLFPSWLESAPKFQASLATNSLMLSPCYHHYRSRLGLLLAPLPPPRRLLAASLPPPVMIPSVPAFLGPLNGTLAVCQFARPPTQPLKGGAEGQKGGGG